MDNGPARNLKTAQTMQEAGHRIGDPFEISTIRRDVSLLTREETPCLNEN